MEDLNKQIEESPNELMQYIRHEVEDILHLFFTEYNVVSDYDVRNELVLYVYGVMMKKYSHHSSFDDIKKETIKNVAVSYLIKKYLQSSD